MSTVTKIGVNLSKLQNLTAPVFNISNDPKQIIRELPRRANELTNNTFGLGILVSLFVVLFATLSDKTPLGNFGYSNLRAFSLCSGICAIFSVVMIQIGFIYTFRTVGFFMALIIISLLSIALTENRQ